MKRKILSLILVFAMTVSLLTVGTGAVEPTYGDTAGHWAESSIERWSGHGIIQGSNGLFDPNGQLTCAQLATILAKLLKLPAAKDAGFTDNTADAWYYDAINRCAAAGILNGNGDGTVTPKAPITRERAMVMLARALGIEPIRKPDLTKYTDAAQVSAYAQGYVAALIEAGIVGGVTADELAPQDNINRASTVTILDRAISTYADQAGATVKADGKGIVLVVAENVKITGAPEGTKIVVADGATGLTVNGKSVSDDQTYIVPKTEPAKPSSGSSGGYSHSHTIADEWSYDDTYHWHEASCGREAHRSSKGEHTYNEGNVCTVCGQVNPTETVAKIGAKNYATLADAMTYAVAGDTIVLKTDIPEAEQVTVGKKVTLDMDSHTITSAVKQVFTVLDSGDLTITGNGTITGPTGDAAKNFDSYSMIYVTGTNAKLTVLNGTITAGGVGDCGMYGIYVADGGNVILGDADTKTGPTITTWFAAVGENNTTSPANITIYGGEYTAQAAPAESDSWAYFCAPVYASASGNITISGGTFNGYYGISSRYVKVAQNLNISGGTFNGSKSALFADNVEGSAKNGERTISITGGTFSSDPTAYVAEGYIARENNGKYVVSMVGTAENPYTLNEFNALKKLPAGRPELYVDIGVVSLADGDVTIGNKDICDMWTWDRDTNHTAGEVLADGRKVYMVRDTDTIYSSNKAGITLYISGSVKDNKEGGLNNKGDGNDPRCVTLSIPDASNVVFTEDFTVNGYFRMYTGWSDGRNLGGAVYNRTVKTVLFNHSTFNGIWIQNGGFGAENLTLDGCTFNAYENKVSANDSNPLWFCNTGSCDITVMNCNFTASRPIKLAEQSAYGTKLTIVNNTFDMSVANTANKDNEPKNDAIMLCKIGNGTLGNVVISGNTVENGTALMAFYNSAGFTMAEGANFTVSGNTLGTGVKTSVVWKSTTEYKPDFVTVTGTPL